MGSDTLYDQGERFRQVAASGVTTIRTTPTRLKRVVVNSFVAGSSVGIYNSTTNAPSQAVGSINSTAAATQGHYEYDLALSGGLTISLAGNPNVTVVYQ